MAVLNRFEDLPVWKLARKLTNLVYQISSYSEFNKDFGLRDQIRRAAISVMANIAEGFEHETQAQFISYLGRAKASAGEVRCQLYIAYDLKYISNDIFKEASLVVEECSRQIYGYIKYLRTLPNSSRVK